MRILFLHQNFPGQFKFLAPELVKMGHQVVALTLQKIDAGFWEGVELIPYTVTRGSTIGIHPWLVDFETKTIRAEACYRAAIKLSLRGFSPDLIVAHPGWGESLFIKEVWSTAKLAIYCEFYYRTEGGDIDFDSEFRANESSDTNCMIKLKNINNMMQFDFADAGLSPTYWQASTFPDAFREKITVIHDGIDTSALIPNPLTWLTINDELTLSKTDEVVTFISRNLEPYRGFHIFMRALPELLKQRPKARVLIVGGDDVSYGGRPSNGQTWKAIFIAEVRPLISDADWQRVHFLGFISYSHYKVLLQISTVHVYLTYPFVLSWSLLEAMSFGCAIVASDTQPLQEVIKRDINGRLVNFFDVNALTETIVTLLDDEDARQRLGQAARIFVKEHYDLKTICLPKQIGWVNDLLRQDCI